MFSSVGIQSKLLPLLVCSLLLVACGQDKAKTLDCNGEGSFQLDGPKESYIVTILPGPQHHLYQAEVSKDQFGVVYRGPMLTFSQTLCDPARGWGEITAASESVIRFRNGLSLIALRPIDTLRSDGITLTLLAEPSPRSEGIESEAQWVGSASGFETYVTIRTTDETYMVTQQSDFRLRFGGSQPDSVVKRSNIQTQPAEPYLVIRNVLSKQSSSGTDPKALTFLWPSLIVTESGHLMLPTNAIRIRCEQTTSATDQLFLFGMQISSQICNNTF